tara:strand:+ start:666 stop:932 length:267 start_codon:yes stop_codon:yes gene_type:complete
MQELTWHYADGVLSITTESGVTAHLHGDFASEAVNIIARLEVESRPLRDFLSGLFLCACATEDGFVTVTRQAPRRAGVRAVNGVALDG